MPTYIYRCDECGHEFKVHQKMTDDPLKECPECGGSIHRVITGGQGLIGDVRLGFRYANLSEPEKMKVAVSEPKKMDEIFARQREKMIKK